MSEVVGQMVSLPCSVSLNLEFVRQDIWDRVERREKREERRGSKEGGGAAAIHF